MYETPTISSLRLLQSRNGLNLEDFATFERSETFHNELKRSAIVLTKFLGAKIYLLLKIQLM